MIDTMQQEIEKRICASVRDNFDEQKNFLVRMVETPSVNGDGGKGNGQGEIEVARQIYKELEEMGVKAKFLRLKKDRPNVLAMAGGNGRKSLILVGNMDTARGCEVGAKLDAVIRGGRMYGVGVLDMKASLSAYVYALKAIIDAGYKLEGKLKLAFVVDGKGSFPSKIGLQYLINKGLRAKAAILAKPGTDKIAIGHRGGYRFKITTLGESVNTGRRDWERKRRGRNAVLDMLKVCQVLSGFELPFKPAKAFPGRQPVFTFPTKIQGGNFLDTVPDKCEAWGDVRLMPGNTDKQVQLWIRNRLGRLPDVKWELEGVLFVPSMEIERSEPVVQILATKTQNIAGKKPKIEGCGPWNDAWMLTSRDVPCIAGFGPDGGESEDSMNEYVDLESLRMVTEILSLTLGEYLGLSNS